MSFTARHYNEVARIIRETRDILSDPKDYPEGSIPQAHAAGHYSALDVVQHRLRRMFAADNPRFDTTRFDMACEPKEPSK